MTKNGLQKNLIEARSLMGESGVKAFDRITILKQTYNDKDFKAEIGKDDFYRAEYLDSYLNDLCLTFLEALQMFTHYPKREQWKSGELRKMYDGMVDIIRKSTKRNSPNGRRSATIAQVEALEQQVAELKAENRQLKRKLSELEKQSKPAKRKKSSRAA